MQGVVVHRGPGLLLRRVGMCEAAAKPVCCVYDRACIIDIMIGLFNLPRCERFPRLYYKMMVDNVCKFPPKCRDGKKSGM